MEFELEESAFMVGWDVGTRFKERKLTTPEVLRNSSGKYLSGSFHLQELPSVTNFG